MKLVFFSTWGLWITSALSSLTSTPCITCGCSWLRWPGPKTSSETLWMVRSHFIVLLKQAQWSPACVFMLWFVSQMWRYLVWRRSYRSCCHGYTLKLCCMATSPNRFVWKAFFLDDIQKRQVCLQTIPVQINEPYCFLSTVCLMNLWIFFFCKLVIHWISSRIDKSYVLSRFSF